MKKNNLSVTAIQNGTVIDHIQTGQGLKILPFFSDSHHMMTLGLNLKSALLGLKDLIKIEGVFLTEEQSSFIALFSPQATVNVIRETQVVKKYKVQLPHQIEGLLSCPNSFCITHIEWLTSCFFIQETPSGVFLRCHFCEKVYHRDEYDRNQKSTNYQRSSY